MIRLGLLETFRGVLLRIAPRASPSPSVTSSMRTAAETLRELARAERLIADLEGEVRDRDERIDVLVRERILARLSADAAGSMLLDVQQECIAAVKERAKLREQLAAAGGPTTHAAELASLKTLVSRADSRRFHLCDDATYADVKAAQAALVDSWKAGEVSRV